MPCRRREKMPVIGWRGCACLCEARRQEFYRTARWEESYGVLSVHSPPVIENGKPVPLPPCREQSFACQFCPPAEPRGRQVARLQQEIRYRCRRESPFVSRTAAGEVFATPWANVGRVCLGSCPRLPPVTPHGPILW